MPSYRELVQQSIRQCVTTETKVSTADLLVDVFETLLEAERTAFFENPAVAADGNKRNGYYGRFVHSLAGKLALRIPRDRAGQFQPLLLEVMRAEQERVGGLATLLYAKGMPVRDIRSVIADLYDVEYSTSWVSTMTARVAAERERWQARPLDDRFVALYIDALWVPIRRTTVAREAVYIILGIDTAGIRSILGLYTFPEESATGWTVILQNLKERGIRTPTLVVADGLAGLPDAVRRVFPGVAFQSCLTHKKRNVLLHVRAADKAAIADGLRAVFAMDDPHDTLAAAHGRRDAFVAAWAERYPKIAEQLALDRFPHCFTYLAFPHALWRMIATTNWIERLNREVRKGTKLRCSFPNEASALTAIFLRLVDVEEHVYRYPIIAFRNNGDALRHPSQTQRS